MFVLVCDYVVGSASVCCGAGDPLPAVIMPSPRPEIYNAPVSYTCSYNSISSGNTFWFMNGTPVSGVGGVLDGGVVRHSSFYQCYVLLLESQQVFYGERTVVPQREY